MGNDNQKSIELVIDDLEFYKETPSLRAAASKVITLPTEEQRQPDLLYFSGIFVTTGTNLNGAHFLGSELVFSRDTISNKAMDIEHKEVEIVGHIYDYAFVDVDGKPLSVKELSSMEVASQDAQEMHVTIAGVIYKNRFPELAKEVIDKKWRLSMECYFQDFDIKIGDMILTRPEATALGLACKDDGIVGKYATVLKEGVEIAAGNIARVLRGICFSGCGFVKKPANPPSVILETASDEENTIAVKAEKIVLSYESDDASYQKEYDENKLTTLNIDSEKKESARDGLMDDTIGQCPFYKRHIYDKSGELINEDWCSMYDQVCTSFSRDKSDPDCLMNKDIASTAVARVEELMIQKMKVDKRKKLLSGLRAALREAAKTRSR